MKKLLFCASLLLLLLASCGSKKGDSGNYPKNFNSIGDAGRVEYMMQRVTADSLARFIVYSALGRNPEVRIDTLAIATNYAYEKLSGDDSDLFSSEYDSIVESLPLGEKMKIYQLAASEDPQKLGYRLGLEYMTSVRDGNKTADQVEAELSEFKKACGSDTAMYRRFIIGFHTVLELDHGTDVPEDIYTRFINYE